MLIRKRLSSCNYYNLCPTCSGSARTLSALGLISCKGGGEQNPNHVLGPSSEFNMNSFTLTCWHLHSNALVPKSLWIFNSSLGPSTHTSPNTWSLTGGVSMALFSFPMVLRGCLPLLTCIWRHWEFQWERCIAKIKESCLTLRTDNYFQQYFLII